MDFAVQILLLAFRGETVTLELISMNLTGDYFMTIKALISFGLVGIISVFLLACSGSDKPEEETPASKVPDKQTGTGVIPKHQMDALNRAKNTESMLLEADEKRRKKLEELQ